MMLMVCWSLKGGMGTTVVAAGLALSSARANIPDERVVDLEAIKGWTWDALEDSYQQGLAALKQFVEREGHANVVSTHKEVVEGAEHKLGQWVSNRRTDFRKGKLAPRRVSDLEAIKGWTWSTK